MWFSVIPLKNLLHRKTRSGLTCLGIGVAVCGVVTLIGVSHGFEQAIGAMFETRGVDIVVNRANSPQRLMSTLPESLRDNLGRVPGVERVEPMLVDVVSFDQGSLMAVYLLGWEVQGTMLNDLHLLSGEKPQIGDRRAILLGKLLAQSLDKQVGDVVEIQEEQFKVFGIYESKSMFEEGTAIIALPELQEMMSRRGEVAGFLVRVMPEYRQPEKIQSLCRELEAVSDDRGRSPAVSAQPLQEHVAGNLEIRVTRAMVWSMSFIALVIGAVSTLNTMMISVFERTREIGTLLAVGWSRARIGAMVLEEAVLLSCAGIVVGLLMSIAVLPLLRSIEAASTFIPRDLDPWIMVQGSLLAVVAGLVGAIVPVIRASRMMPTEALRHE